MTGGSVNVPNMRTVFLHVSILAVLAHTMDRDGEDSDCDPGILVLNANHEAQVGEDVEISCVFTGCNSQFPNVSWFREEGKRFPVNTSGQSRITTKRKRINSTWWRFHLAFKKISLTDAGRYLCHGENSIGHLINVSVHGSLDLTNPTWSSNTNSTSPLLEQWMYMFTVAGTVAFVSVVIFASVLAMQGCKGKKTKKQSENHQQYEIAPVPKAESLDPHPQPGGSREVSTPQKQNASIYAKPKTNRGIKRTAARTEEGSVLYASLNHQPLAAGAPHPRRQLEEEQTEYAAILVS